ncbi:reverse transcriptase domain-containing protein, partial [Tanacetum coccineum]
MLRRNLRDTLRRKGCDDSFLHWSMLRRNPLGMLRRKVPWALHFGAFLVQIPCLLLKCSLVTYTSVYNDSEPWRFYWVSNEEPSDVGSPGVILYGYDGLPMHPVAPPSLDYVPGPEHPPSLNYVPMEDQPLLDDASPTALSSGYVADFDPDKDLEEDPEEDHANYPADGGDGDDESFDDDDDADDEDDDEEEEEHLTLADSSAVPVVDLVPSARDTEAFETDESAPTPPSPRSPQIVARLLALPTPLTLLLSPLPHISSPPLHVSSSPLPLPSPIVDSPTYAEASLGYKAVRIKMRAASPPLLLPSTSYRTDILEAEMPPRKRACFTTLASGYEVGESSTAGAARQHSLDIAVMDATVGCPMSRETQLTTTLGRIQKLKTKDLEPQDEPAEAGSSYRSRNGDDNHDSGTSRRRQVSTVRECTYTDFLKCQPLNFKGTEGVVGLTQWLEKMESVFHISNCTVACQVKFASCTLQGNALTWWNSYVRTVGHNVAYAMPWKTLKKMMTDKYCPRGEIKKLETKISSLLLNVKQKTSESLMALQGTIKTNSILSKGIMWHGLTLLGGNGYSRKGRKIKQKRQNQARDGKDKVKSKP